MLLLAVGPLSLRPTLASAAAPLDASPSSLSLSQHPGPFFPEDRSWTGPSSLLPRPAHKDLHCKLSTTSASTSDGGSLCSDFFLNCQACVRNMYLLYVWKILKNKQN